jgi:cation diffusion facilitator CzcD-associated flavoprotein CzcO
VGASWRAHYDRLHLHTPKEGSALPGLPFAAGVPRYPSRAQVVEYLEAYAATFGITPRFGRDVVSVRRDRNRWRLRTAHESHEAEHIVIATGYNRVPHVPSWPDQETFQGPVLHSSAYRNGAGFRGRDVLVVGLGNSGGEIAIDLVEHGARVGLAVRGPVNVVPRDILGIPAQKFSIAERCLPTRLVDAVNGAILRVVRGSLAAYGLERAAIGPATQIAERGRIPLIDIDTIDLIRQGHITVYPGVARFTRHAVVFTDGSTHRFDAVVLATGYRRRVDAFLEGAAAVCDDHGIPRPSGSPTALPGLYFCGFHVTAIGALREIGLEAWRIVRAVGS